MCNRAQLITRIREYFHKRCYLSRRTFHSVLFSPSLSPPPIYTNRISFCAVTNIYWFSVGVWSALQTIFPLACQGSYGEWGHLYLSFHTELSGWTHKVCLHAYSYCWSLSWYCTSAAAQFSKVRSCYSCRLLPWEFTHFEGIHHIGALPLPVRGMPGSLGFILAAEPS